MLKRLNYLLLGLILWLPVVEVKGLPCDTTANPVVCAFLNRYLGELQSWNETGVSVEQKMYDDKFIVLGGSLDNIKKINDSTAVSINRYENKAYEVIWESATGTLLRVAFPIQYELLLGMPQNEIELKMEEYIRNAEQSKEKHHNNQIDTAHPLDNGICVSKPIRKLYTDSLTDAVFYCLNDDNQYEIIGQGIASLKGKGQDNMRYAVRNMFHSQPFRDFTINVAQRIYGFKKLNYQITLQQWLNYCEQNNLHIYTAIEAEDDAYYKVFVVAANEDLGYNHLLSLVVPKSFMFADNHFECIMNAFVPTHNVSNLFQEYNKDKKKIQW